MKLYYQYYLYYEFCARYFIENTHANLASTKSVVKCESLGAILSFVFRRSIEETKFGSDLMF